MSDAVPTADAAPSEPPRRDRSWLVLLGGIVFVIAVATTFSLVMTRDDTTEPTPAFSAVLIDQFDRPASDDGLGGGWLQDAGGWAVDGGFAVLRRPVATGDNLATHEAGATGQAVNLKVGSRSQCGVVVRYHDAFNFIGLLRASPYAVWNLIEVVDGKETTIAKVPDEDNDTVSVTLTATDGLVSAAVGLKTVTLVRDNAPSGTRFGLIARGQDASACTWDEVVAQRAN